MEKEDLQSQLTSLEKKIHKLILKCNTLKKEHDRVVEENIVLKETIKQQQEEIENFKSQEKLGNIVAASITATAENRVGLKKKLNEYIDEVDKCIAHLSE